MVRVTSYETALSSPFSDSNSDDKFSAAAQVAPRQQQQPAYDPRDEGTPRRRDDGNIWHATTARILQGGGFFGQDPFTYLFKRRKPYQYIPSPGCAVTQPAILQGHQGRRRDGT